MKAPQHYRKQPVVVEAIRFTGENLGALNSFAGEFFRPRGRSKYEVYDKLHNKWIPAVPGDWIIKGIKGEFYPCENSVFALTYEWVAGP